jgi:hypothetical protein
MVDIESKSSVASLQEKRAVNPEFQVEQKIPQDQPTGPGLHAWCNLVGT